jgi:hypothetical protein
VRPDEPTYRGVVADEVRAAARTVDGAAQYAAVGAAGLTGLVGVAAGLSAAGATYAATTVPRNLALAGAAALTGTELEGVADEEVVPLAVDPRLATDEDDPDRGVARAAARARDRGAGVRATAAAALGGGVVRPADAAGRAAAPVRRVLMDGCERVADGLVAVREGVLSDSRSTPERVRGALADRLRSAADDGSEATETAPAEARTTDADGTERDGDRSLTDRLADRTGEDGDGRSREPREPEP